MKLTLRNARGAKNGEIRVIQFGDFQCLKSLQYYYDLEHYLVHYPGKVTHYFKHLPFKELYYISFTAALISEWAARQNKFWRVVEELFLQASVLSPGHMMRILDELGMDSEGFLDGVTETCAFKNVLMDQSEARCLGLNDESILLLQIAEGQGWSKLKPIQSLQELDQIISISPIDPGHKR